MKTVVNKDKKFKKGTYYVGDLCYVFTDKQWDEVCDVTIDNGDCLSGTFKLKNGCEFALYGTAYGDGEYPDGKGRTYPVDSGSIGCVEKNKEFIHSSKLEEAIRKGLGHLIEMDSEFTTGYNDEDQTEIYFGDVVIMTAYDEDEDEDEDEDYYDEDEDDEDEYEKGGNISQSELNKGYQFNYELDDDNSGSIYKEGGIYFVKGFENRKHYSESFEKFSEAKDFYLSKTKKMEKGGKLEDIVFVREKVYSFLNPMGYSAKVEDWGNGVIHIEPSTTKVGKNRKDFFDGMQIHRFDNGIYEVSEYQAGPDENEMYIYKQTKSLIVALKDLIKGNKRKPIKKYAKGGIFEHGLEIGDTIKGYKLGNSKIISVSNGEKQYDVNLDLGTRNRSKSPIPFAKGGGVEKLPKKRFILYTNPNNITNRGYVAVGDDVKEVLTSSKEYPGSYRVLYQGRGTDEDLQKAKSMFSDYSFSNDVSIMTNGGALVFEEDDEIPGLNVENQLSNKQVDVLYKMKPKLEDPYYPKELIKEVGDIAYYKVMINDNEYLLAVDTTGNWDDKWYIVKQNVTPAIASKSNIKEEGAAGVRIELENGNVTVYHSDSNEILLTLNDVPQGTWKKLWNFLRNDLV